ncbi:MAG: hypothetical protein P4L92_12225 [Rudaea sp.]|nr:hypothetical protein [Rudaea sp.]
MSTRELNLDEVAQRLLAEPSADLWPRIAQAHQVRRQRRRRRRIAGAGFAVLAGLTVVLFAVRLQGSGATDWQARAQALEIQLHAGATSANGGSNPLALDAEAELVRVDGALQAAYDHGAKKNELVPLWKQRSELLSALLAARRQSLAVTRI